MPDDDNPVIAFAMADLHFSHTAPAARRGETDWYGAMARTWNEAEARMNAQDPTKRVPLLLAGDIFDRHDCPVRLVNFVASLFSCPRPKIAIPGQHDLPHHRLDRYVDSPLNTLDMMGRINDVDYVGPWSWAYEVGEVGVHVEGFPWGVPLAPCKRGTHFKKIALCHHFCWADEAPQAMASTDSQAATLARKLHGFDYAIFGDHHRSFTLPPQAPNIPHLVNCGPMMQRTASDVGCVPKLWTLRTNGPDWVPLWTDQDVFDPAVSVVPQEGHDASALMSNLKRLQVTMTDVDSVVRTVLDDLQPPAAVRAQVDQYMKEAADE